jgi:hypothetical protein
VRTWITVVFGRALPVLIKGKRGRAPLPYFITGQSPVTRWMDFIFECQSYPQEKKPLTSTTGGVFQLRIQKFNKIIKINSCPRVSMTARARVSLTPFLWVYRCV